MNTIILLMQYPEDLFGRNVDLISLIFISLLIETPVKAESILCMEGDVVCVLISCVQR